MRWRVALSVLLLALAMPAVAVAAFPGEDPDESVRENTPDDPRFDCAESDDEQDDDAPCSSVFDEQFERFGFAPDGSQGTALYANPADTKRQQEQNAKAGRNPLGQLSGVSADRAWKRSIGRADVDVAILDTGIQWKDPALRTKVDLNEYELPRPRRGGRRCGHDDCNRDGAFNVDDYADDPRVDRTDGHPSADGILDASDLIAAFSDGADTDDNGYVDDIAGWDFFDDDNDPYDASSYSSAVNHGTGRAKDAAEQTDDGAGGAGVCPRCQIMPIRVWDTFVVDTNNFAMGVLYAADNKAEVVEGAIGGLYNSRFARDAFRLAYRKGIFMAIVSSDLNTGDHNFPTTYDEAMMVQGTVADTQGVGMTPPNGDLAGFLSGLGVSTNAPIQTWFRNSGTTQYGGHAHIVMPAVTGSEATGQASGAAGLVASYGRQRGIFLKPNEIKQLLTLTAEDVVPENTANGTSGIADPAQPGWDQHFGYGRPDLGLALERIAKKEIPPEALITSPDWFQPFNVLGRHSVGVDARLAARRARFYKWRLEWAPGIEPREDEFRTAATGSGSRAKERELGRIDLDAVRQALDERPGGGATADPTAPQKGPGDADPNEPAFTVRVRVEDDRGVRGEDRKTLFAYRDETLHDGWSKAVGSGGEASERLYDLDGDNKLDIVQADSGGRLSVMQADGSPLKSFGGGSVRTRPVANLHPKAPPIRKLDPPREVLRTPAIGDVDGDRRPDIVASAGEHVYAWDEHGRQLKGFPVRLDPAFSRPADRTRDNHVKRGFIGSPVLGDLDADGELDIVIAGLDQHVYAWDGRGKEKPGFPVKPADQGLAGAEIINTVALGDIDGDDGLEIVTPTAEFDPNPSAPAPPAGLGQAGFFGAIVTNFLANASGGSGRVYAIDSDGKVLDGWPTKPNGFVPDALPLVGPGEDHVLGNVDSDSELEAIGNVATGDVEGTNGDGSNATKYDSQPASGEHVDKEKVINFFENPVVADLDGVPGLEVIKGGITINQLVNLGIAVGQNLPYNHVMQAWNAETGASLPAFPQAVEDYQLLSSPAVADVDKDTPGNEILVGTGLYLLRTMNAQGAEDRSEWPKFAGGWLLGVPAVGDADGDGKLEVSAITREGHAFLWDTDQDACADNEQWWTSRHDEFSSGAYGTDSRPPGTPRRLRAERDGSSTTLTWRAPGGDWLCGKADRYRVIASSHRIDEPSDGHAVASSPAGEEGDEETETVETSGERHFAVLYRDEAGNWGHLKEVKASSGGDQASTTEEP